MLKKSLTVAASLVAVAIVSGCYVETGAYRTRRINEPTPYHPGPVIVTPINRGVIATTLDKTFVSHNGEFNVINITTYPRNVNVSIREDLNDQITVTARVAGENAYGIDEFISNASHDIFSDRLDIRIGGDRFGCVSDFYNGDYYVRGVCLRGIVVTLPAYWARTRVVVNGALVSNPVRYRERIRPIPVPIFPVPAYPVPARPHRRGDVIIAPPSGGVIYAPGTGPHRGRGNGGAVPAVVVPNTGSGRHRR